MRIDNWIRQFVLKLRDRGAVGSLIYIYIKYSAAKILCFLMGERRYSQWFYNLYTGKQLNLDNPVYFDEKLWWLKLNNRNPLLTTCSDKNKVREYVADCGFGDILIPQVGTYGSSKQIDFAKYEDEVIVKCNHNSGGHMFYNPTKPASDITIRLGKRKLDFILSQNASVLSREWNYKNIKPCIVVEKVIRDKNGNLPLDYKFLCFGGEPKLLFLDLGVINKDRTYNHDYCRNIYDMDFNLLPVYETRPNSDIPVPKPENFEYMVEVAKTLSKPFPFCRVDLYNVDGKVYFGEITFYHGGGCNEIKPEEWDLKMGSWIDLKSDTIITDK